MTRLHRSIGAGALALAMSVPAAASAQLGNPAPQSVAMAGNYTALAHGFGAVSWNPAGLGLPGNTPFSLAFLPVVLTAGLDPITPASFMEFGGDSIPHAKRVEWLEEIRAEGGEAGNFATDLNYLGLSIGRIGLQVSSNVRGRINMAPDVAEVFLFGNAGFEGEPRDYTLAGSTFDMLGTTTVAASYAQPIDLSFGPLPFQAFAVGVTVKYTIGNFLVMGQESGSTISSNPLEVNVMFPMLQTPFPDSASEEEGTSPAEFFNNGTGIGVDVGVAWKGGIFTAGATVRNLVNTFEWDREKLQFRAGTAVWNQDTTMTSFEKADIADAPAELLARLDEMYTFSPILAAGVSARLLPFLTVSGELRHAIEDNLDVGAQNHVGVGAELTIIPILPLRAGASIISGGFQLGGGAGLKLGPMQINAAGALRDTELGGDAMLAFGLTFGLR